MAQNNERLNQAKELKRLEYEVDLNSKNGDTDSDFNSVIVNLKIFFKVGFFYRRHRIHFIHATRR